VSKKPELPKPGERVPASKFHVSKFNVRASEPFGESEEDKQLIANLRRGRIIGPFKARPEGAGWGVFVGRRRYLAKNWLRVKHFVVGVDWWPESATEEEAWEASLVENLEVLRQNMDPMTRAHALARIVDESGAGLRGAAVKLGLKVSTLSEWLKPLELSPKMQKTLAKGNLFFTDALHVAKMGLGKERQDELAEVVEKDGMDAFRAELARLEEGRLKRGIPKGKFTIIRTMFDHRYHPDMELLAELNKLAETAGKKIDEYTKWVLSEHVKAVAA